MSRVPVKDTKAALEALMKVNAARAPSGHSSLCKCTECTLETETTIEEKAYAALLREQARLFVQNNGGLICHVTSS